MDEPQRVVGTLFRQTDRDVARPCVECLRMVYTCDARSRLLPPICPDCFIRLVEAEPRGVRLVLPPGVTPSEFVAIMRSGQLPRRN